MRSESEIRAMIEGPIPDELQVFIDKFVRWQAAHVRAEEAKVHVDVPLYQYTGLGALRGIIESESMWCTHYLCMNDPNELSHGIEVAHEVVKRLANSRADRRLRVFRDALCDLLVPDNFPSNLVFYTASFTAQRDDVGQWERYGEKGRGVAIGFSPSLFGIVDAAGLQPNEMSFVGPVLYERTAIFDRHEKAIRAAASVFFEAAVGHGEIMADMAHGLPFLDALVKQLMASPLIWNCITSKEHAKWAREQEVRLILMGQPKNLDPYVSHHFGDRNPSPTLPIHLR
jgi:hypothetical protein